jgi:ankyrin repeat protein
MFMVGVLILFSSFIAVSEQPAKESVTQAPAKEPNQVAQPVENIDALNKALRSFVLQGNKEKLEELIARGADVNIKLQQWGMSLLHMAVAKGPQDIVLLLINKGARVNARDNNGRTPLHYLAGAQAQINKLVRDPDMVTILVNHGADINAVDNSGLTPLHYAVSASGSFKESGFEDVVESLITHNADVNALDSYGLRPLHYAVIRQCIGVIRLLLAKEEIAVDAQDNLGRTALHYAAGADFATTYRFQEWPADIVQLLLDHGADINARDSIGRTPLFYVLLDPDNNGIKFMVERGADLYCADNRGYTPYSWVVDQISFQGLRSFPGYKEETGEFKKAAAILEELLMGDYCVFVSPDGQDANPGTSSLPLRTIPAALDIVGPGNNIVLRGGTYHCPRTVYINKSGEAGRPIRIIGYPGETPILDFSQARGFSFFVTGAYWHLKNLLITQGDRGVVLHGNKAHHNILDQLSVCENGLVGIHVMEGAAYNIIVNCDVYKNVDLDFLGNNADGVAVANNPGQGNTIIGTRCWNNSDDGFDFGNNLTSGIRLEHCYAWDQGKNIWGLPFFGGNGNGFKFPGAGRDTIINCVAWDNLRRGFDAAISDVGVILINCTSFRHERNYRFEESLLSVFSNNLSYGGTLPDGFNPKNTHAKDNAWNSDSELALTDSDFLSVDDSVMTQPRNPDGSIPRNDFLRLAPGSAAIDKGIDVGMPFVGARPDLGAFEYDPNETFEGYVKMLHQAVRDHDVKKIEQLLAQGEGINEKDWLGYTPLHWAVYFGYPDLIELLISKGADSDIQSNTGRYALEIARAMAYPELEALLCKLGAEEDKELSSTPE